jgi:predicted MFS family arabinose efflux permease
VRAVAFFAYSFATTFPEFLLAEFVDAVGTTLATGALDAWAVDGMRAEGNTRPAERFFARAHIVARVPMMLAGLAAGYVAAYGLHLPFVVGCGLFVLTGVVGFVLMYDDRPAGGRRTSHRGVVAMIRDGLGDLRRDPTLAWLCGLTLVVSFAAMPAWHYWPPRMQALSGQGVWLMGWIFALINVTAIAGNLLLSRLAVPRREPLLATITALRGGGIAVAAAAGTLAPALAGFMLFELGFGVSEPVLQAWVNERATAERRATVLSVRSMAFTLGGSLGLVCLGLVARATDIPTAWLGSAAVFAIGAAGFVALGARRQRVRATAGT